jgi:hypothetical protein
MHWICKTKIYSASTLKIFCSIFATPSTQIFLTVHFLGEGEKVGANQLGNSHPTIERLVTRVFQSFFSFLLPRQDSRKVVGLSGCGGTEEGGVGGCGGTEGEG